MLIYILSLFQYSISHTFSSLNKGFFMIKVLNQRVKRHWKSYKIKKEKIWMIYKNQKVWEKVGWRQKKKKI